VAERREYQFEWDPAKAEKNAKAHGITFEQAATVFLDSSLLSQLDEEHNEEERWGSLGLDRAARLLVDCHTFRRVTEESAATRIISARKSSRCEAKQYEKREQ
jgi:uncharacterized DUF497 family protein